jgi:cytochrome c-type biogenesis protein
MLSKLLRTGFAVSIIGLGLVFVLANRSKFPTLDVGSAAPPYEATSLSGDTVSLAALRGRVVLLNVWATWCAPCIREMPALQKLHEDLGDDGLSIVAVSVDANAPPFAGVNDVKDFVAEYGLTFTILHDDTGAIENVFGVTALPMTFVIDRNGRIQRKVLGPREWNTPELASEIRALLEG